MSRKELIEEIKKLVASGEMTDIEGYIYANEASRTKAKKDLQGEAWEEIKIRKHYIYIKR
jgi:hypothetical protein